MIRPKNLLACCLVRYSLLTCVLTQDYFLGPIDCYTCVGTATNSSCGDPFTHNDYLLEQFDQVKCDRGACLKRLYKSHDGEPMIVRTCSNDIDFKLPLVHNVCQKESDGFGYLCMCGMPLCNKGRMTHGNVSILGVLLSLITAVLFHH